MLNDYKLLQEKRKEKILAIKFEPRRSNKIIDGILYNQDLISKVKSISRREWNSNVKYWKAPYEESMIVKRPRFTPMSEEKIRERQLVQTIT